MVHRISGWIRHRIEWMVHCYPTDEFHIFFCLKRKRADIRSIRSDPINPMAHHRLKKKTGLRLIRSIRSIRSGPIDPMAHHRLSAAIRGLNFLSRMESSRDHPADGLIGFIRIAPLTKRSKRARKSTKTNNDAMDIQSELSFGTTTSLGTQQLQDRASRSTGNTFSRMLSRSSK